MPELSQFEVDVLTVFYRPAENMALCRRINLPENFEQRKAAIERLTALGLISREGEYCRITHAGHTYLDELWGA